MAAMRTALAGLCRRGIGNSRSSMAAASVGGKVAAPRAALLPSLRPAALRNIEGWRRFSTEGMEGSGQDKPLLLKHKFESILHLLWQRSRDSVKNVIKGDKTMLLYIGSAAYLWFLASTFRAIDRLAFGSSSNTRMGPNSCVGMHRRPIPFLMLPVRATSLNTTRSYVRPGQFGYEKTTFMKTKDSC